MRNTLVIGALSLLTLSAGTVLSADLNWRGRYNFEGVSLRNAPLDGTQTKEYFMHHLVLKPKIIASDGINIYGRFDLMNNDASNSLGYKGGDYFGGRLASGGGSGTEGQTEDAGLFEINQLYLTWLQEHGSLIVGRMPMEFGLGLSHDAGEDPFDHYLDNVDGIGYKVMMGNLYFLPIYGKHSEGPVNQGNEIYQYYLQVQYENPDTDLSLGLMYDVRVATPGGNDGVGGPYDPGTDPATTSAEGEWKTERIGLHVGQTYSVGRLGLEANFYRGNTGIHDADGDEISIDGFGFVGEFMTNGKTWDWGIQGGYLTGDDPDTSDRYEGFVADRNYDVGMILFNHPVGKGDVIGGSSFYANNRTGITSSQNVPDVAALTNTLYLAPKINWNFSERWSLNTSFLWAQLNTPQYDDGASDLGYEIDASFVFKPNDALTWSIDGGVLLPGSAFEGGGAFDSPETAYGIQTRAAISF